MLFYLILVCQATLTIKIIGLLQKCTQASPQRKENLTNSDLPQSLPVVVIFKDFEAFNSQVLQDFILICRWDLCSKMCNSSM